MVVLNAGNKPTFLRGVQHSHIGVTLEPGNIVPVVSGWRILDEENLSEHPFIICDVRSRRMKGNNKEGKRKRWKVSEKGLEVARNIIRKRMNGVEQVAECVSKLQNLCEEVFKKLPKGGRKNPVYWWNEEIDKRSQNFLKYRKKR